MASTARAQMDLGKRKIRPRSAVEATDRQEGPLSDNSYPAVTRELVEARRALAPEMEEAFRAFSQKVFADGALPAKTKELIAVAVAHVTQCPYCIKGHTRAAKRRGASPEEIMEAIWVAAEMRAGGAWAHATLALTELGVGAAKGEPAG
jgi:AhpD family alkylhydroperoxidase